MTTPRAAVHRVITGIVGRMPESASILRRWSRYFRERGMDAVMHHYPCTPETLSERLGEMLHFDRRGYIVAPSLQEAILPLMDALDPSARAAGRVDTVTNDQGVLIGSFVAHDDHQRRKLWGVEP